MTDWNTARKEPLPGDWAARPLYRLHAADRHKAICIETVPDAHPDAIDGHRIAPVAAIYKFLKSRNVKVPEIYQADPLAGIMIMEDFGDMSWARWTPVSPEDQYMLYPKAVEILQQFKSIKPDATLDIPEFHNSYIFGRTRWYLQHYKKIDDKKQLIEFIQIWDALIEKLHHEPVSFVHGDFHPGNLMKLDDGSIGILDVGGAFWGAGLYDLVNLLEDIRRDVPDDIKTQSKKSYGTCDNCYAILHAQFYMRLLGQMTKRGMDIPKRIPESLNALVHRFEALKPLKNLVLS